MNEAEGLVGPDVSVPNIPPSYLVELYLRIGDVQEKRGDLQRELVALEKALTPARALASAPKDAANSKPLLSIAQRLEAVFSAHDVRGAGDTAYLNKHYGDALVCFEVLQYFDEFEAAWKGHSDEYARNLNSDPNLKRLLEIPSKLIAQGGVPAILASNIQTMGPLAGRVRSLSLSLLASYYMSQKRFDMVAKYTKQALEVLLQAAISHPINGV